jgi:hypothetical protein
MIKTMSKKTLTALQGSIRKWESIARGEEFDRGVSGCSLCQLYFNYHCQGCPVHKITGNRCNGTPYETWDDLGGLNQTADCPERKQVALAEVRFLKSLLPKGKNHE